MGAIITDTLKRQFLDKLYNEVSMLDSHNYSVGIGHHEQWDSSDTVPDLVGAPKEELTAKIGLQSVKTVTDIVYTVPRYNWSSGTIYQAYDDAVKGATGNGFYVLTDLNEVYVCIQQGKNAQGAAQTSTIKPSYSTAGVAVTRAFETSDGYVWKMLYTLSASNANKFLTSNFLPIPPRATGLGAPDASQIEQQNIEAAAVSGQVLNIVMTNEGSGYGTDPTITINGDGVLCTASPTRDGNQVKKIELDSSADSGVTMGHNFKLASVSITGGGGTGATARAVIGPKNGLGYDPKIDLKSTALMINCKPAGTEGGKFFVGNDFRQVSLIRNAVGMEDSAFTAAAGIAARHLIVTDSANLTSGFVNDAIFTGGTSNAKGIVLQATQNRLYFTQNETTTGFKDFQEGEGLTVSGGSATLKTAGYDSDNTAWDGGDIDIHTGEILYIDNRAAIERSSNQTEDIKIILEL